MTPEEGFKLKYLPEKRKLNQEKEMNEVKKMSIWTRYILLKIVIYI